MAYMTVGYYEQIKDYLHPHINQYINHYRDGDIIDLPQYHGCNRLNRIDVEQERKLSTTQIINASFQLIKLIGKKTKNKYKSRNLYRTRYLTITNYRHLFENKGKFVFNYKLKKYEHLSETPMRYDFYRLQNVKERMQKNVFK